MEKSFLDPVHGFISIDEEWLLDLVDTPEFQRLRRIRQLGVSAGTYHGAEHSRFGHSIGVFHVMKSVLAQLVPARASLAEEDRRAALAAALLHDIGHGPFSHALENLLTPGTGHEGWGEAVITGPTRVRRILAEVDPGLPRKVADLIRGRHQTVWLRQLVAGQLDVDRFDYLLRDSLYTGTGYGRFDLERIVHTLRVVDGRLALQIKGLHAAEEYVLARHFMYWRVYLHKTIRAQELMLRRAVFRAKDLWAAGEAVYVPPALAELWTLTGWSPAPGSRGASGGSERLPGRRALEAYLDLDDADLITALKQWRRGGDRVLADLSRRLLDRDLLKPLYRHGVPGISRDLLEMARRATAQAGWDPDYYCLLDVAPDASFQAYAAGDPYASGVSSGDPGGWEDARGQGQAQEPILIVGGDGVPVELSSLSPLIHALRDRPQRAMNIFLPAPVRDGLLKSGYVFPR